MDWNQYVEVTANGLRMPTRDRHILENVIFSNLFSSLSIRRILFVGVHSYSSWYGQLFAARPEISFVTVDSNPLNSIYGSIGKHWSCNLDLLIYVDYLKESFDVVILNGVFGYGTDTIEAKQRNLQTAHSLLNENGLLILGYRDKHPNYDFTYDLIGNLKFSPCLIPGLPHVYEQSNSDNGHAFASFRKTSHTNPNNLILSSRYRNDGVESLFLNEVQISARLSIATKINEGVYQIREVSCPICKATLGISLAHKDMYGIPMGTKVCGRCGQVYTWLRFDDETMNTIYNNEYRAIDRGVDMPVESFFAHERTKGELILRRLSQAGLLTQGSHLIAEIGCGAGGVLAPFRDEGHRVLGVDINESYIKYGRETHGLELHKGTLQELIDHLSNLRLTPTVVIYEQTLQHITKIDEELTVLRDFLEIGSFLYVAVPGLRNIEQHYNANFLRYLQFPHLLHFELAGLTRLLKSYGFMLVEGNEVIQAIYRRENVPNQQERDLLPLEVFNYLLGMEQHWINKQYREHTEKFQ